MKYFAAFVWILVSLPMAAQKPSIPAIVIHGGAGTMEKGSMSAEQEADVKKAMERALEGAYRLLADGGSAVDAVVLAISVLEDSPLFNAGKGAVMNAEGTHELDASIMNGADLNAGAIAGATLTKNPIQAAHKVMTDSPHVMLTGKGADHFARRQQLGIVENEYFTTEEMRLNWRTWKTKQVAGPRGSTDGNSGHKYGTVGAVAIDKDGNIAAGTSTGGMMGKEHNRVGDSPIIGAGTYADNNSCGVSCTGHGEYFIRIGVAKEISDQILFGKKSLQDAAKYTIGKRLSGLGGTGGIIAIDREGNIVMEFNTPGMYRGYRNAKGTFTAIYANE
jgi:beta-aspartyl-peptidase (threonine type)